MADFPFSLFRGRRLAAIRPIHEVGAATETTEKKDELLDTPVASEVNENGRAKRAGMSSARGKKNVVVGGSKGRWIPTCGRCPTLKYPPAELNEICGAPAAIGNPSCSPIGDC